MCLISLMFEGGFKSAKNRLSMGDTIGGDTEKSGNNTHLLVIMCARLLEKLVYTTLLIGLDSREEIARNNVQNLFAITA